jgi:hypothetical protein
LPREALLKGSLTLSKKEKKQLEGKDSVKKVGVVGGAGHSELGKDTEGTQVERQKEGLACA